MFKSPSLSDSTTDANLVFHSLGGDKDAFCKIVKRYQTLLCSIAYSSVGDLKRSEDIAQETFIEAWKKLDSLREPTKLKSWLCGILRFKITHNYRQINKGESNDLLEADEKLASESVGTSLDDTAIEKQHESLMWKALNEMPDAYREPMILFYREQQSVERVAMQLDINTDTVKQRLTRGRRMLKQSMAGIVEQALSKSKPGSAFTAAVLLAINGISPPAKATALGASAAKSSSVIKLATLLTLLAIFSGFISSFFGLQASLDQSRTDREKQLVKKVLILFIGGAIVFVGLMLLLKYLAMSFPSTATYLAIGSQITVVLFVGYYLFLTKKMLQTMRETRRQERLFNPQAFLHERDQLTSKQRETISSATLFGVPLFHFQFGMPEANEKPAFAWIAGGSYAKGLLFAWGGVAVAPVSVGIVSVGVFSIGAIGFGIVSLGTVAVGAIAFGASAIGLKAYSSLSSLGWESALSGGFAIAHDAAVGYVAFAEQVNNDLAGQITHLSHFQSLYHWPLGVLAILVITPAYLYAKAVRKRMKQ